MVSSFWLWSRCYFHNIRLRQSHKSVLIQVHLKVEAYLKEDNALGQSSKCRKMPLNTSSFIYVYNIQPIIHSGVRLLQWFIAGHIWMLLSPMKMIALYKEWLCKISQDAAAVVMNSEVMDPFPMLDRKLSLQWYTEINQIYLNLKRS